MTRTHDDLDRARAFLDFDFDEGGHGGLPSPGERLGEYVIESELARGANGVVYRARQDSLGRTVAVKVVPAPLETDPERRHRVEREGRLLAGLRHPSLCQVHGAGIGPGFTWTAMELIEGRTLREILAGVVDEHPGPADAAWLGFCVPLLTRAAGALGAAHVHGVIHRDVKPENVIVTPEGAPYLVDFGLAREESPGATVTRDFVGTPRYASPEQVRGETLTAATDVFSFGALAFEVVSGLDAFPGDTTYSVLSRIERQDVAWGRERRVPRDLRAVVDRCLEKRAIDRYRDGTEIEAELTRIMNFEPVLAVHRGPIRRTLRRAARRPVATMTFVLAVLLVATVIWAVSEAGRTGASFDRLLHDRQLEEALASFHAGDTDGAREIVAGLLALEDLLPDALSLHADLDRSAGHDESARRSYRRRLELADAPLADRIAYVLVGGVAEIENEGGEPAPITGRDHALLGERRARLSDLNGAAEALNEALALHPSSWRWRLRRGEVLHDAQRFDEAVEELRLARELRAGHLETTMALVRALRRSARFEELEGLLAAARVAYEDHPALLAATADCLWTWNPSRRGLEAASFANRALEGDPTDPEVVLTWWEIHGRRDRERTLAIIEEACAEHPAHAELIDAHLGTLLRMESPALVSALEAYEVRDDGEIRAIAKRRRATHCFISGETETAERLARELEAEVPPTAFWQLRLARMFDGLGQSADAIRCFNQAIELDPHDLDTQRRLAEVLVLDEQFREAVQLCVSVYERSRDIRDLAQVARAYYRLNERVLAVHYAELIVENDPDSSYAWATLGMARSIRVSPKAGDLTDAEQAEQEESFRLARAAFARSFQINESVFARVNFAHALFQAGYPEESEEHLEKALELTPSPRFEDQSLARPTVLARLANLIEKAYPRTLENVERIVDLRREQVSLRPKRGNLRQVLAKWERRLTKLRAESGAD